MVFSYQERMKTFSYELHILGVWGGPPLGSRGKTRGSKFPWSWRHDIFLIRRLIPYTKLSHNFRIRLHGESESVSPRPYNEWLEHSPTFHIMLHRRLQWLVASAGERAPSQDVSAPSPRLSTRLPYDRDSQSDSDSWIGRTRSASRYCSGTSSWLSVWDDDMTHCHSWKKLMLE